MTWDVRLLLPFFSLGFSASLIDKAFWDFGASFFLPLTVVAEVGVFFVKVFVVAIIVGGSCVAGPCK
jgi:hypothetical protein